MTNPQNFDQLYPGRFLKAGLLQGKTVTVTISAIYMEELEGEKGKQEKAILAFEGKSMQLVLCKLNGLCIKEMFGPNLTNWLGKRISIYPTDQIAPMKRGEDCIRIWGSPDIEKDITISIQLPKRKAFPVTLRKVVLNETQPSNHTTQPQA